MRHFLDGLTLEPMSSDRYYTITIDGETVSLTKALWDKIWEVSLSQRISMEAAYLEVMEG